MLSRRDLLRTAATSAVGAAAASVLAGCTGFATSGSSGLIFFSTQFNSVQHSEMLRRILAPAVPRPVSLVTADSSQFVGQVQREIDAGSVRASALGGLHGELASLSPDALEDATGLQQRLGDLGWAPEYLRLAQLGTGRLRYIPWVQAGYVLAAHEEALAHLPPGADPAALTYDQLLDWAIAARRGNGGRPMLGLPAGPKGLLHRFLQGYLYPSFTGGQVTTFRTAEAVEAWKYLRELWANCVPTSTTYSYMQEPLRTGEVRFAWDHIARLVQAPEAEPSRWRMVPAPRGPKGLGHMPVLAGLAIPRGAPDPQGAREIVDALSQARVQVEVLRATAFLPVVRAALPPDLPPAIRMAAAAVERQRQAPGAVVSLPPQGLGKQESELTKLYQDSFKAIVLDNADIASTLNSHAEALREILVRARAACWAPDPDSHDAACAVL